MIAIQQILPTVPLVCSFEVIPCLLLSALISHLIQITAISVQKASAALAEEFFPKDLFAVMTKPEAVVRSA